MKTRKHHNNKGNRQISRGRTESQVRAIARKIGIPYRVERTPIDKEFDPGEFPGKIEKERIKE